MISKKVASLFLLAVMVLSALGVYSNQEENTVKFEEYTFYPAATGWQVNINNKQYFFRYLPTELDFPFIQTPKAEKIYIAYDPSAKNITVPIGQVSNLLMQFGMRVVPACINKEGCPDDFPIIDCNSATAPVIYLRSAEEKKIIKENQCLIVQAPTSLDLDKAVEKMAYYLLGVIKNE